MEKCDYRQAAKSFLRALDLMEHDPKQSTVRKKMFETVASWNFSPAEQSRTRTHRSKNRGGGGVFSSSPLEGERLVAAEYDHGLDHYRTYFRSNDTCDTNIAPKILFNLGRVLHNQGQFDMAMDCYLQLLLQQQRESRCSDNEILCLAGLFSMGHCRYMRGDLRALPTYWAALSVAQKLEERHHEAACMNAIGMVILSMPGGKHQVALQAFQTSLEIRRQCHSEKDHHEVGITWNNMGQLYYKQGNYPKALEAYNQALRVRRSNRDAPDGIDVAATLLNLGQVCNQMKNYQLALRYYEDFLRLAKIHFGEYHEDVCNVAMCVGQILQSLGHLERSLKSYQDALRIAHLLYCPIHPDIAAIQKKIATQCYFMKKYDLALQAYHVALDIELQIFDEADAKILVSYTNIAEIHKVLGEFDQSLTFYEKVLKVQKSWDDMSKKNQMAVATTLNRMAHVHYKKGDFERALEFQQECLHIQRDQNGDDANVVASSLFQVAWLLLRLDSSTMAMDAMLEACRVQKKNRKEDTQSITALCHVASIYHRQGFLDSALVCYYEAARIQERILGTGHTDFGNILFNTSRVYYEKGELEIALQMLRRVLQIEVIRFGIRDQRSLRTLILIGDIETNLGNLPGLMEAYGDVLRISQASDDEGNHVPMNDATLWRMDKAMSPGAGAA